MISLCGAPTDLIDSNGCTALHYAVTLGHADATSRLLDFEADSNRQDRKGRTPAHCGCAKGQFETVKLLRERNANLWLRNAKGDLPLHEAATSGRRELVEWLLEQRPKQVNTTSNDGRSLLHIAASHDYTDLCKLLLDYKADVNAVYRNNKGVVTTPLDCALQRGHRSTAKFLQSHGGLPSSKLRLAARRSNPFNNTPVEIIKPLKYAEKEEIHDPTSSKKYVVYLKRSDSEGGEETNCSCTEQTYKREQRYAHTCRRHQRHKRHPLRRRTSSCGDPLEYQDDCGNICRSKSNIEIRRRKSRERYSSSSEWEDDDEAEDSCENCCYHKRKKQRVVQRRRSTPSKKSRHTHEPEDNDKTSNAETEKGNDVSKQSVEEDSNTGQQKVQEKEQNKANVPETLTETPRSRRDSNAKPPDAMPTTPQTAKEGTFIKTPPETPQTGNGSAQTEDLSRSPSAAELTDGEDHNLPVMESVLAEVQVHRAAEESEPRDETGNENESQEKEPEASKVEIIKEKTEDLTTSNSLIETKDEIRKESKTSEEISSEEKQEPENIENPQKSKEEEGDTMDIKDSIETVIEVNPKDTPEKIKQSEESKPEAQETESNEQSLEKETIPNTSTSENEFKSAQELQRSEKNVEAKATEDTSKETMSPEPKPATTATSAADSKQNEDEKKQEQQEPKRFEEKEEPSKTDKETSITYEGEQTPGTIEKSDSDPPAQNERQQESRRSFTLLPSDSAEDEIEIEVEEPTRKTSFQVLKSDESVLEVEESPSPRDEHEMSDNAVFKVLTEPHIMSPFEGESMKSDDIIGHTALEPTEEEMDEEKRFRMEQATGSPYDYGSGRKRRLKKRVKSGVKTRGTGSTWKRSEADGSDMQQNTRDQDSGFEPSPRTMKSKIPTPRNVYTAHIPRRPLYTTLDGRSCSSRLENRKLGDKGACDMSAVTRSIQRNIRR